MPSYDSLEVHTSTLLYNIEGPTAPTNTALIWVKGLRRFADLALRHEAATIKLTRENLDKDRPTPKASKFNKIINRATRPHQRRPQTPLERECLRRTI